MPRPTIASDVIGLAKPRLDAHMLGMSRVDELLQACGFKTIVADEWVCEALCDPSEADNSSLIRKWL